MFDNCISDLLDYGCMEMTLCEYNNDVWKYWIPKYENLSSEVWAMNNSYYFSIDAKEPSGRYSYLNFYLIFSLETCQLKYSIHWQHGYTEFEVPMDISEEQYFQLSLVHDMWMTRDTLLRIEDYLMEFVHIH